MGDAHDTAYLPPDRHSTTAAVMMMLSRDKGNSRSSSRMSWSGRKRGSVQRMSSWSQAQNRILSDQDHDLDQHHRKVRQVQAAKARRIEARNLPAAQKHRRHDRREEDRLDELGQKKMPKRMPEYSTKSTDQLGLAFGKVKRRTLGSRQSPRSKTARTRAAG